jgi:CRP-like cAMP-binding protein
VLCASAHKGLILLNSLYFHHLALGGATGWGANTDKARVAVRNNLLSALPRKDLDRLIPHLEPVPLKLGDVLYESGGPIRHCYFPNDGVVSLLTVIEARKSAEVGMVGREGLVGMSAAVGINVSQLRAVVQGTGSAMRITAANLQKEFAANAALHRGLFRFNHSLMGQVAQTAACNRFHKAEMRLARWLLVTRDRLRSESFRLTHDFLSLMIGVRRVGVTNAAGKLANRNLISYSRGNVRILDSKGLQAASCGCYGAVKAMYREVAGH